MLIPYAHTECSVDTLFYTHGMERFCNDVIGTVENNYIYNLFNIATLSQYSLVSDLECTKNLLC